MIYKKVNSQVTFEDFLKLSNGLKNFKSLTGCDYLVKEWNGSIMTFERVNTNKLWKMDLKNVYTAYKELSTFRTIDFKPYVNRAHSPALGLLLTLKLLKIE